MQYYFKASKKLFLFIVIIIFNLLYFDRYIKFEIGGVNIYKSLLFINFSFFLINYSYNKFNNIINPISIYSVFILFLGYSYINLSTDQLIKYSFFTEFIFLCSIFSFLIGSLIVRKKCFRIKIIPFHNSIQKSLFYILFLLSVTFFLLEIKKIGYFPVLNLGSTLNTYADSNDNLIPFGHYFVLYIAFYPSLTYIYYKKKYINKFLFITIPIISFFIISNYLSRQNIMLMMLTIFFTYIYYNNISIKKNYYIYFVIYFFILFHRKCKIK